MLLYLELYKCESKFYLQIAGPRNLVDRTLNPLGFSPLLFEPRSGHMWESQVLLADGQVFFFFFCFVFWVFFPGFSGFRPPLMNDRLDILERADNPNKIDLCVEFWKYGYK